MIFIVTWKVTAIICGACPNSCHSSGKYGDGPTACNTVACCHDEIHSEETRFDFFDEAKKFIKERPSNASDFHLYEKNELPL